MPDDPYPRAEVVELDEPPGLDLEARIERCVKLRRKVLALTLEMGSVTMPLDIDLPGDAITATWVLCRSSPLGPFDQQLLLEAESATARLDLVGDLLTEQVEVLEAALRHQ